MKFFLVLLPFFAILHTSCNSSYTPKPKGYFKVELPKAHAYQVFERPGFPYTFEYPVYAGIVQDSTFFEGSPENDYWINVDFPAYRCKFYLSYNPIGGIATFKVMDKLTGKYKDSTGRNSFDKLVNDAFNLSSKHLFKSNANDDSTMRTPNGLGGVFFRIGGNAASPMQFFLTDSTRHFIRGSLYYDAAPNADSTMPISNFLYKDLQHLVNTLKWR
jgi:hypothetical protein